MHFAPFAYGGWTWLGFGLHGLLMLAFWGVLIWAAIVLVRAATRGWAGKPAADNALTVLRERFARGELTQEQFSEMRETLR